MAAYLGRPVAAALAAVRRACVTADLPCALRLHRWLCGRLRAKRLERCADWNRLRNRHMAAGFLSSLPEILDLVQGGKLRYLVWYSKQTSYGIFFLYKLLSINIYQHRMCSAMCSCSCSWAHCRKAHAIHTAHIHMHRASNACMPTLPNVHWAPPCDIHPHSMHTDCHIASAASAALDPPLAYQPTQRYEARQQMLNILTGDVEGVDIELELSIRPATRGQTGGQDQGPPLPGHRDGTEQAVSGKDEGKGRIFR